MCCMKTNQNLNSGHCTRSDCNQSDTMQNYFENPLLEPISGAPIVRSEYEQMWDLLRAEGDGVLIKTVPRTIQSISYDKAKAWLKALVLAGYVEATEETPMNAVCATYRYKLIKDIGQQPPQIDGKGRIKPTAANDLIWRTLRILKNCNAHQIIASGSTPETLLKISYVRQYLRALYLAGYLKAMPLRHPRALASYQLIKNTGPKAPEVQRGKKIYDGNLGLIVYDPATPLPPAHQKEAEQSKQKQTARAQAKRAKREARRHV